MEPVNNNSQERQAEQLPESEAIIQTRLKEFVDLGFAKPIVSGKDKKPAGILFDAQDKGLVAVSNKGDEIIIFKLKSRKESENVHINQLTWEALGDLHTPLLVTELDNESATPFRNAVMNINNPEIDYVTDNFNDREEALAVFEKVVSDIERSNQYFEETKIATMDQVTKILSSSGVNESAEA